MDIVSEFSKLLGIITILGNILLVLWLAAYLFDRPRYQRIMHWLSARAIGLGLAVTAGTTVGSLVFFAVSEIPACILCWIQRIFMYPLVFLFGLAFLRKERVILPYALMFTVIGGVVSLYHWTKNMLALYADLTIACPVVPGLPSCETISVLEYGYVTLPMIALNVFIIVSIILYTGLRYNYETR